MAYFTRRSLCRGFAAMAVLPLAARCGAMAQTYPERKIQTSILEVPGARSMRLTAGPGHAHGSGGQRHSRKLQRCSKPPDVP